MRAAIVLAAALVGCASPASDDLDGDTATEVEDPGSSRSYAGGWPVRDDLDDLPYGDWAGVPRAGKAFPPFVGRDQFGEEVYLYDFYGQGPVVLDLSTMWCGICHEIAAWLGGKPDSINDAQWPGIQDRVDSGQLRWITVLNEDGQGRPATEATVRDWHERHPHPDIPVLLDANDAIADFVRATGYPTLVLLDENLRIVQAGPGYAGVLDRLVQED